MGQYPRGDLVACAKSVSCQGVAYDAHRRIIFCFFGMFLAYYRGFLGVYKRLFLLLCCSLQDDEMDLLLKRNDEGHEFHRYLGGTYDRGFFLRPD